MLLSSDSCKIVQELIVKGKYQSSVVFDLTALGFNIRVPTQIVIEANC